MTEHVASSGVLGTLGINGWGFVAHLVDFLIVLFVMWRWVYKPLLATMEKRTKEITDGLQNAKDAKLRLSDAQSEKERLLKEARDQARAIVEEAQARTEDLRKEKLTQAKEEIEKIVIETKQQIKGERDAAFAALKGEIADLVTLATGKVVAKMDEKDLHRLVQQSVKEIEKS